MREALKLSLYIFVKILSLPIWGSFYLLAKIANRDEVTAGYSQFLSLIPGKTGVYIRKACYEAIIENGDKSAFIGFGVLFSHYDTHIHQDVYVGPQCNIGKCKIERNCLLGSGVHIMSGKKQHNFSDPDTPLKDQGGTFEMVTIGENSWLGNGALILANVGKKCVVAAGAVVIDPIPDNSIVAGNPAKVIKQRPN